MGHGGKQVERKAGNEAKKGSPRGERWFKKNVKPGSNRKKDKGVGKKS